MFATSEPMGWPSAVALAAFFAALAFAWWAYQKYGRD